MTWWPPEGHDGLRGSIRRVSLVKMDDSGTQQKATLSGLASEEMKDIVRVQPFGLTSHPPAGAEGVLVAMGGRSDRAMVLGVEHKDHRPKDSPAGTSVLYDDKGNVIFMKGDKGIRMKAKKDHIVLEPVENDKNVYLGGDPDNPEHRFAKVMTISGASKNVFARIP